jgi:uncharacterized protein YjbJ (UPF0337 family)
MNKDQVKGRTKEVKGATKEVVGKVTGNDSLELKGKLEKVAGKMQKSLGDAKSDIKKGLKQDK